MILDTNALSAFFEGDPSLGKALARVPRLFLPVAGTPIPSNDVWIAVLARQHQLPIVTRDGHFDAIANVKRIPF